ncbi:hypothetical protein RFI_15311 [Reticulomyxa filosa]|uniref:Uncharacterized protein n=1 Tax=Reticulomyxa filosa TaxID=46433 RepID=X6N7A7_RETFI|nr:hypothetical protein RFI_15311 [Reticulomyxa filosa]|eukprot:ETO21891.1 hypothetical protein RFI_15311 [Reticulomyxa filosa]
MSCLIWMPMGCVLSERVRVDVLEIRESDEKRKGLKRVIFSVVIILIPMLWLHLFVILALFSFLDSANGRAKERTWMDMLSRIWSSNRTTLLVLFAVSELIHIYNCFGIALYKRALLICKTHFTVQDPIDTSTDTASGSSPNVSFDNYSVFFGFYFISFFIFSCYYLIALPLLWILFITLSMYIYSLFHNNFLKYIYTYNIISK